MPASSSRAEWPNRSISRSQCGQVNDDMFWTMPITMTPCSRSSANVRSASIWARSWGVVTKIAPESGSSRAITWISSPVPGGASIKRTSAVQAMSNSRLRSIEETIPRPVSAIGRRSATTNPTDMISRLCRP